MAVFVFIESKRLNLLNNGSILKQRNILLSKIMCKVTSNPAGTAPNRREERKEVLSSWTRRENRNQTAEYS